jgi:hypothetical protein
MGKRRNVFLSFSAADVDEAALREKYLEVKTKIADMEKTLGEERSRRPARRQLIGTVVQMLDLVLDPKKADEVIGDLLEQYPRRLAISPGHAERWLVAQTVRVIFGRALDVIRQVAAARAGR